MTRPAADRFGARWAESLWPKLVVLVFVFAAVPIILYQHFQAADREKQALLIRGVQEQGRIAAAALQPVLERFDASSLPTVTAVVRRIVGEQQRIRVLFRPGEITGAAGFYYIASEPPAPAETVERERADLIETGILDQLGGGCGESGRLAVRYTNPTGQQEVLTSVNPVSTKSGCWVIVTASTSAAILGSSLGRPYWRTPELQVTAAIYLLVVTVVLALFLGIWSSLRGFARLARDIRSDRSGGGSFAALNRVGELSGVAEEFDAMVARLRNSAEAIRYAAEENAHAFKTPIAVIEQALEPLRRSVPASDARSRRAVEMIEKSVARLDALVGAARRIDKAIAGLVSPPREPVDLSALAGQIVEDYAERASGRAVRLQPELAPGVTVLASEDLLETVLENLLDNAIGFSPQGGTVQVRLVRTGRRAALEVADQGPGIDPVHFDKIFDRYFSHRPPATGSAGASSGGNFGIGLWIVRRNVEAVGGAVEAENRTGGGLVVRVSLPPA